MNCPSCNSPLIIGGRRKMIGLNEHVLGNDEGRMGNFFECYNSECSCCKQKIFWNDLGELFSSGNYLATKSIKFIDDNNAPIPSWERKMIAEIYNNHGWDSPKLFGWYFFIDYDIQADEYGRISFKKPRIQWVHKGVHYILGIHMLLYMLQCKPKDLNEFERKYDKRWWSKLSSWLYKNVMYRKLYLELKGQ
jgi:hypothetical protein